MTERSFAGFVFGNLSVGIFFYGTWLLSWWIPAFDRLLDGLNDFQWVASWFIGFFVASFIPLRINRKKACILKAIGFASAFSFALFCLVWVSNLLLAPLYDPMF
jgi:hypothetical protein